ncbi:MAG: aminotransferase, partial [Methanosarcinaceae archaeon]
LDLKAYKKSADKSSTQTPYTPAIPLFYGLQEALHVVREEGIDARITRHSTGAAAIRAASAAMGIAMFPDLNEDSKYSNTVSAMKSPEDLDSNDLKKDLLAAGIVIAGGQGRLSGKIFRIGSMGNITSRDILQTIQQLELAFKKRGLVHDVGPGVEAAAKILNIL